MSTGDLLSIEPQELQFPFELRKEISCSLRLSDKTDNYVAFKVMTTKPKNYGVRPNRGIVLPSYNASLRGSTSRHAVQGQVSHSKCNCESRGDREGYHVRNGNGYHRDFADSIDLGSVDADINLAEFVGVGFQFNEETGRNIEKCKMRVVYVAPPRPPSRAQEVSSPPASISDSRNLNILGSTAVSA